MIQCCEMDGWRQDDAGRAIQSAEHREIAIPRDEIVCGAVDPDSHDVVTGIIHGVRCVKAKLCKAANMRAQLVTIEKYLGDAKGGVKLQQHAIIGAVPGKFKVRAVPSGAAVVIAAEDSLRCVPGMRQGDGFPRGIIERRCRRLIGGFGQGETPLFQRNFCPGKGGEGRGQQK